ncbi:hypothetical protein HBB06_30675 (plasmid) [Streptomyces sp. SNU607]|uniref:hypothetical protein n=1 Tax=Streptomyces sp. SNU607 TaxID=2718875 RepID=UPI0026E032FB|nr:hypothetical protein [Streptomyces sp. SNU607]WKV82505.1 hypothetical protein HBB06_30675 [Streptomyces sp. SNU607]
MNPDTFFTLGQVLQALQHRQASRLHTPVPRHPVRTPSRHDPTLARSASTRRSNREDDDWDEADWAELEEKARAIARAGWWIDQREADGPDLLELLDAATEADCGTQNPFR